MIFELWLLLMQQNNEALRLQSNLAIFMLIFLHILFYAYHSLRFLRNKRTLHIHIEIYLFISMNLVSDSFCYLYMWMCPTHCSLNVEGPDWQTSCCKFDVNSQRRWLFLLGIEGKFEWFWMSSLLKTWTKALEVFLCQDNWNNYIRCVVWANKYNLHSLIYKRCLCLGEFRVVLHGWSHKLVAL